MRQRSMPDPDAAVARAHTDTRLSAGRSGGGVVVEVGGCERAVRGGLAWD